LEKKLGRSNVSLASFILSKTSYDELIKGMGKPPLKDEYFNHNVLFLDDKDWAERLFSNLNSSFEPS
jgi:hypothetical protein